MTFNEHSTVLTGYDANYIYLNDPYANIKDRRVSHQNFQASWNQFGRQAITYNLRGKE